MANSFTVNIPKPPDNADLKEIHKWTTSFYSWALQNFGAGTQATFMSQDQLDQMVALNDLKQAGKVFMNHDTGKINVATVVAGALAMQVV